MKSENKASANNCTECPSPRGGSAPIQRLQIMILNPFIQRFEIKIKKKTATWLVEEKYLQMNNHDVAICKV